MAARNRAPIQDDFMADNYDVIVATPAFGAPRSVDAYYQEIGRAGHDGERAEAILFFRQKDRGIHKFFAGGSRIDEEKVRRFVEAYRGHENPVPEQLKEATGLSKAKIARLLTRLSKMGAVEVNEEIIRQVVLDEKRVHDAELDRIEHMRAYAESTGCRREYLLGYFGEAAAARCDLCDRCESHILTLTV